MQTDIMLSLARYVEKLPALPTSISKIMEVCNDPATSAADLSKVISLDPVLMGRVMKLINSAYYGLNNKVTSLVRAIIMLGFNTVKNLALSAAILGTIGKTNFQGLNIEAFWIHSLSVGVTAKIIAKKRGEPAGDVEEYFIAGLLHDIGKIPFVNKVPGDYNRAITYAGTEFVSLLEGEDHELSCNHCEIGRMIATNWQLSESLSDVIAHHHETYAGSHQILVQAVCVANYFSNIMEIGFSGDKYPDKLEQEIFANLRISLNDLKNEEEEIKAAIENARIFLHLTS